MLKNHNHTAFLGQTRHIAMTRASASSSKTTQRLVLPPRKRAWPNVCSLRRGNACRSSSRRRPRSASSKPSLLVCRWQVPPCRITHATVRAWYVPEQALRKKEKKVQKADQRKARARLRQACQAAKAKSQTFNDDDVEILCRLVHGFAVGR